MMKKNDDTNENNEIQHGNEIVAVGKSDIAGKTESSKFPRLKLRLGELLIKNKVISQEQLSRAIEKQKKTVRPRLLGDILVDKGFITREKLMQEVKKMGKLGDLLVEQGFITRAQLKRALDRQNTKTYKRLIGDILIEMSFLTEEDINLAVSERSDILVSKGLISRAQLQTAMEEASTSTRQTPLGTILVELGYLTEDQLIASISKYAQIPYLKITRYNIPKDVLDLIPSVLAYRFRVIPLSHLGNILTVAMVNPFDYEGLDELERITGMKITRVLVSEKDIASCLDTCYIRPKYAP
jgi:hypothetical protein